MEQIEPIGTTESAKLPIVEPRWDPEKAGKRKVRVVKVPYGEDPMTEKTVFEFGGFVYICYAVKTRGRYMIRCLGIADVESAPKPELTPYEAGKILEKASDDIVDPIDLTPAGKALNDAIDNDIMREAIESEDVQKVIAEVTGDG